LAGYSSFRVSRNYSVDLKTVGRRIDLQHGRIRCQPDAFSTVSVKGHTVIPREVGKRLKLKSGDTLRCRLVDDGILLVNSTEASDEPFAAFWEWTSEAEAEGPCRRTFSVSGRP
jgi:bifunctional DNA-binding transcriptional regulator/antitoxin component of YhaV-PrlF toxin-antitoxin module